MYCSQIPINLIFLLVIAYIIYFFKDTKINIIDTMMPTINDSLNKITYINETNENKSNNTINKLSEEQINSILDKVNTNEFIENTEKENKFIENIEKENEIKYNKFITKDRYYNKVERINNNIRNNDSIFNKKKNKKYDGKKIKDIYDELVENNAKNYSKKCLKKPFTDPYSKNKMYLNENNTFSDSNWEYENECPLNGGEFDKNLYGYYENEKNSYSALI